MTLLTPALAVAGVCAVAIPILIHLLARQRRRPIEFAAMRFLIEAFKKHKRRLQLEQLLLLAVRCLILAVLGFALARPIIEGSTLIEQGGSRTVTLVIDDGLVSGALGEDHRPALRRHIDEAIEIVRGLGPGDTVSVVTASRPAKDVLDPPSSDHSAVIALLESLAPRQSPTDLPGAMSFVTQAAANAGESRRPALVYLLSDFRVGSASLESPLPSTLVEASGGDVTLLAPPPASEAIANTQVTAIQPVRSLVIPRSNDGSDQVKVRLSRGGDALAGDVSRVRLTGEGLLPIEPRAVTWTPGQSEADVDFVIDFGLATDRKVALTASIDDDALDADNQRHAILDVRSQLRVLLIDRRSFGFERTLDQLTAGQWVRRALEPLAAGIAGGAAGGPITIVEAEPAALDVADLRTADVAIMPRPDLVGDAGWLLLRQFVDRGGLLLVMPPGEVNVHQWTTQMNIALGLPWRLSLEVVEHGDDGLAMAVEQPASEILRMISSDLGEMARPVLAYRTLPMDAQAGGAGVTGQTLLAFADGSPMLILGSPQSDGRVGEGEMGRGGEALSPSPSLPLAPSGSSGLVMYLAAAPQVDWTNLPTKPLMVPLLQEIVRQGMSVIRASQKVDVGDQPSLLSISAAASDLQAPSGRMIPLLRGAGGARPQQPLDAAGVYTVLDAAKQPIGLLAVNVEARAGQTEVQSPAAVSAWLARSGPWTTFEPADIAATLGAGASGSPIAGILLAALLALVILETLLARWFSHAYRGRTEGERGSIAPSIGGRASVIRSSAAAQGVAA